MHVEAEEDMVGQKRKDRKAMAQTHMVAHRGAMRRRESTVANLPPVKVRGLAVGGIAAGGVALRALATGAIAAGAAAIGALAVGTVAVGRIRVGDAKAKKLAVGRLEVDELIIGGQAVNAENLGPVIGRP